MTSARQPSEVTLGVGDHPGVRRPRSERRAWRKGLGKRAANLAGLFRVIEVNATGGRMRALTAINPGPMTITLRRKRRERRGWAHSDGVGPLVGSVLKKAAEGPISTGHYCNPTHSHAHVRGREHTRGSRP